MSRPPASEEPHLPGPDAQEATGEGAMGQAHNQAARARRPNVCLHISILGYNMSYIKRRHSSGQSQH